MHNVNDSNEFELDLGSFRRVPRSGSNPLGTVIAAVLGGVCAWLILWQLNLAPFGMDANARRVRTRNGKPTVLANHSRKPPAGRSKAKIVTVSRTRPSNVKNDPNVQSTTAIQGSEIDQIRDSAPADADNPFGIAGLLIETDEEAELADSR